FTLVERNPLESDRIFHASSEPETNSVFKATEQTQCQIKKKAHKRELIEPTKGDKRYVRRKTPKQRGVKTKQVSLCPLQFFLIACQEGDVRSMPGKFAGQGQAKTAGSPGDDHNLVCQ